MDELGGDCGRADQPPPPLPPDDLLLEILLRLPPEPIHLSRASFVSKHWRGLVHDARFLRRFRDFHGGTPPVLGFIDQEGPPFFVPTSGGFALSTPKVSPNHWQVYDCRHGRALLHSCRIGTLLVWDPMTAEEHYLPLPTQACQGSFEHNGAVLCAARHADHHDCHWCPFLVVFVFSKLDDIATSACVFSSETGMWGEVTSIETPDSFVGPKPLALVGNTLYWLLDSDEIIELDLDNHSLGLTIMLPNEALWSYHRRTVIMQTEDGLLGLAGLEGFKLHLWSKVASVDGVVTWTHQRVIDLKKFIAKEVAESSRVQELRAEPIGYAQGADVIFMDVYPSICMLHLKSMKIKVSQNGTSGYIFPYTSFYAPELELVDVLNAALLKGIAAGGGDDQTELLISS